MRKRKGYLVSISVMAAAFMIIGACELGAAEKAVDDAGMTNKIIISDKITDIELELQGNSNIVFVETENVFAIKGLQYSGTKKDPITVRATDTAVKLVQKSEGKSWFKPDPTSVTYELLLPKNRRVRISADKAVFSGSITASDLFLNAGNLNVDGMTIASGDKVRITGGIAHLNMEIAKCKELRLTSGNISGKITVPESAKISNTSGVSNLTIYKNPDSDPVKAGKKTSWNNKINERILTRSSWDILRPADLPSHIQQRYLGFLFDREGADGAESWAGWAGVGGVTS